MTADKTKTLEYIPCSREEATHWSLEGFDNCWALITESTEHTHALMQYAYKKDKPCSNSK